MFEKNQKNQNRKFEKGSNPSGDSKFLDPSNLSQDKFNKLGISTLRTSSNGVVLSLIIGQAPTLPSFEKQRAGTVRYRFANI